MLRFTEHANAVSGIACSAVSGPAAVTTSKDCTARAWDIETGEVITTFRHSGPLLGVACTEVGGRPVAVTTSDDGTAQAWDIETGEVITTFRHSGPLLGVACTEVGGRPVAVTTSDDETAQAWDIGTGRRLAVLVGHTAQ